MKILPPLGENIRFAGDALRRGELVGLPTETVYGIAAAATNREAVLKTFALKGRPAENPLIVHVASIKQVESLVLSIPDSAIALAGAFWPGPLTIVMPKSPDVPDEVTAGLDTVAVRYPIHPFALAVIEAAGMPLSAPSANLFMGLSPTRAEHIDPAILAGLACVIDGGPCKVGVESTVVDCSGATVSILRPGGISAEQIEAIVGPLEPGKVGEKRSPGMYRRHYSPRTPIRIVPQLSPEDAGLVIGKTSGSNQIVMPSDPARYAAVLYASLHDLDQLELASITIEAPPDSPAWAAVWDRLRKMCG